MFQKRSMYLVASAGFLALAMIVGLISLAMVRAQAGRGGAGQTSSSSSISPLLQQELGAGVDPGTSLHGAPAPDFTLTDQFGHQDSLRQFRGKVVILAFTDSQCTTICPLTTQMMVDAEHLLPAGAAAHVQLLGVDANPQATSVADVRNYSVSHGLENQWLFLTGSDAQLRKVWKDYKIYVNVVKGTIDHTPALYVIGPDGAEQNLYLTSGQFGVVGDEAHVLASAVAPLLPGHPTVKLQLPDVQQLSTTAPITLPKVAGPGTATTVTLGPGAKRQLTFFFASWTANIQSDLEALNTVATQPNAPQVVAVDVGPVEPSPTALQTTLSGLSHPLAYPVVVDATGEVADAYQTQDMPWFTLTDTSGQVMGSYDGWEPPAALEQTIQKTLAAHP